MRFIPKKPFRFLERAFATIMLKFLQQKPPLRYNNHNANNRNNGYVVNQSHVRADVSLI